MAQKNNTFIYYALNASTAPGNFITGLTNVRFDIWKINRDTNGVIVASTQVVTNGLMIELGGGAYGYTYLGYVIGQEYHYSMNPNSTLCYIETGVTDNIEQLISEIHVSGGGGFLVNYSTINNHTTNKSTELKKYIDEKVDILKENHKETYDKVNEIDSHIALAKDEVIDTIEGVKPDNSEVLKGISAIKTQNTKLATYIKTESEKERTEKLDEKDGEYSGIVESIESEFKTLLSSKESEMEALKKELEESKGKEEGYEAMVDVLEGEIAENNDVAKLIKTIRK